MFGLPPVLPRIVAPEECYDDEDDEEGDADCDAGQGVAGQFDDLPRGGFVGVCEDV